MKYLLLLSSVLFIFNAGFASAQMREDYSNIYSSRRSGSAQVFVDNNGSGSLTNGINFDGIVKRLIIKNNLDKPAIIIYKAFQILVNIPQNSVLENLDPVILNKLLSGSNKR